MTGISATATAARESARAGSGQFGQQEHTVPEAELALEDDGRSAALDRLARILSEHPEQVAHAREFVEPKILFTWRPDLAYVEYDDKLGREQLDAFLSGDDDILDEIDARFREGDAYEDTLNEYLHDVIGEDPLDHDAEVYEQLREWVAELDRSDVIGPLVRHGGKALIQLPAVGDDDAFGIALRDASEVQDETERSAAIEKVFQDAVAAAGIDVDEHNARQLRELIDENSLDLSPQSPEQWKLRIITYTEPADLAMSSYGERGGDPREVTLEHPWLLLVDPWNGRSHDVKLSGNYATTITPDRPARLDAALGNGSLDNIAGVVHSAYRVPTAVKETTP